MEYNISAITHDVIERKKKKNRILIFFISHTSKIQSKKNILKNWIQLSLSRNPLLQRKMYEGRFYILSDFSIDTILVQNIGR